MGNARERIAVIGAGLMGHGIAQVFAVAGHSVKVFDAQQPAIETLRTRIAKNIADLDLPPGADALVTGYGNLAETVADVDIVIEAAPEKLDLKRSIFAELVKLAPRNSLLASNTSVIPITEIAGDLDTSDRILGTHWWNPPFLVPLVEVVGTAATSPEAIARMMSLLAAVGKTPVHIKKDVAGFVGNRLQHALWREAIAIVADGIADAETVDTVVKTSFGRRLAVLGPLENADLVGTDLTVDIHNVVLQHLSREVGPSEHLKELVAQGKLGMKSGEGFQVWSEDRANALRAKVYKYLKEFKAVV